MAYYIQKHEACISLENGCRLENGVLTPSHHYLVLRSTNLQDQDGAPMELYSRTYNPNNQEKAIEKARIWAAKNNVVIIG